MKIYTTHAALFALAGALTTGFAQSDDILALDGKFIPVVTVTDAHAEKLVRDPSDGSYNVAAAERFTAKIVANLTNFDPTEITPDMAVDVSVGSFEYSGTISDLLPLDINGNPKPFDPAMKGGTMYYLADKLDRFGNPVTDRNGNTMQVKVGSVSMAWTATTLTVNVKILDVDAAGVSGAADDLNLLGAADNGTTGGTMNFACEALPVSISFGSATGSRYIYVKGVTKSIHRMAGGEDNVLNSATLQGVADVTPPVLAATVPTDDGGTGLIDFSGTVTDMLKGTLPDTTSLAPVDVQAFVNDPDLASPIPADDVSDVDAKGGHTFSFTSLPLDPGVNTVTIIATDESGNQTVVTKSVNSTQ